jgi:hypothetical protein
LAELLGMRAKSVGDGRARFELDLQPGRLGHEHRALRRLEPGERCATLEIKLSDLSPVTGGGIFGDGDRRVAMATGTFLHPEPEELSEWR